MYKPYPSGSHTVEPERRAAPATVVNAVKLMYAGAVVSTVGLIVTLVSIGAVDKAINGKARIAVENNAKKTHTTLTAAQITEQVHRLDMVLVSVSIATGIIGVALWLWMARENSQGKNWARILSTVLFCLATLDLVGVFSQPKTVLGLIFPILTWFLGVSTVFLLWRSSSSEFFKGAE